MSSSSSSSSSPFRADCLVGKVALVTGGGTGIGFEIARQLLRHGCRGVVICGRRAAFLKRSCDLLSREIHHQQQQQQQQAVVLYQICDVRKPEDCQAAIDFCQSNFQRLDILVNGAAGNFLARASELSPKGFATVMAIDALGTFNMSRAAYSLLKQSASSSSATSSTSIVVNISATLQSPATWWQAHASAAKSAVDSLTRSLALEWGPHGIRVVGIAPGPIANTPGTTKLAPTTTSSSSNRKKTKGEKDVVDLAKMIERGIPLQRMGEAWEIGQAVVYLATALYVTGDVLIVDGGECLYRPPMVPETMVAQLSRQVEAKSRAQAPTGSKTSMQSKL